MASVGMARGKISRTRVVLLGILATILLIYAVDLVLAGPLFKREQEVSSPSEFMLQLWGPDDIVYTADLRPSLPNFEPKASRWMVGKDHVDDLAGHVIGLEIGPHGSSPSLVVQLPADATVDLYRRAIASLAEQGICQVGIYSPAPAREYLPPNQGNPDWPPEGFVSVYRVLSVMRSNGVVRTCEDRFPPWPPS